MPYHHKDSEIFKTKEEEAKEKIKRKPSKMSMFERPKVKLTDKDMKKLKDHSKLHDGGMKGKHMRNMVRLMRMGMTFSKAHKEAVRLDKTSKKSK